MRVKPPTIKEIANLAQVSIMTVSRALKNDPRVRVETREKIESIAKELGYRPNRIARSLVSNRSHMISLVVADIRNPFFAGMARGIEDKARESGYSVIISSTDNDPKQLEAYVHLMMEVCVDGFILACTRLQEPVVDNLLQMNIPLVLVNRKLASERASYVVTDNRRGAYMVVERLIKQGYRHIAIVNGSMEWSPAVDRLEGYKEAMAAYGLKPNPAHISNHSFTTEHGYAAGKRMLSGSDRPDAIFCASDMIALGMTQAADELGLRIPQDLGLVGFDDTELAAHTRFDLTTVSQRKYEMGRLAVQVLTDLIEDKEANYTSRIVLEPDLIIRGSDQIECHRSTEMTRRSK